MKRKNNLCVVFSAVGLIILFALILTTFPAQAQPITIKFASGWSANLAANEAIKWAGDEIQKRTNGRVKVEYYWAGSMVTNGEERSSCAKGTIDMTQLHPLYYLSDMPLSDWSWDIPFITSDEQKFVEISRKLRSEFPEMRTEIEKYGLKSWPDGTFGNYEITTKFPFKRLSDLKGHKINFAGKVSPKWGRAVGCSTVSIVLPEIFSALQSGVAEGGNWTTDFMLTQKFDQAGCKHITFVGMGGRTGGYPVMNLKKWNSLPPDIQKIVDQVMTESITKCAEIQTARRIALVEEGTKRGVTFYTLPEQDRAEWAKLCKPSVQEHISSLNKSGLPGDRFFKRIISLHEEYKTPIPFKYID